MPGSAIGQPVRPRGQASNSAWPYRLRIERQEKPSNGSRPFSSPSRGNCCTWPSAKSRHASSRRKGPALACACFDAMCHTVAGEISPKWRYGGSRDVRSEEHTSELQSLMRISYAVFCLKKKIPTTKDLKDHMINHINT